LIQIQYRSIRRGRLEKISKERVGLQKSTRGKERFKRDLEVRQALDEIQSQRRAAE
jgi:hypothetical protein